MSDLEPIITKVEDIGWDARLAKRTQSMKSSVIRDLLKVTLQPDMISFAGGLPAPDFFPIREFEEACQYVLQHEGQVALQYGPSEGYGPLKQFLAEKIENDSIEFKQQKIGKVTYHDPCRLGRFSGQYEAPRKVIEALPGVEFIEMEKNKHKSPCCGVSAWVNCDDFSREMRLDKLKMAKDTGAKTNQA